MRAARLRPTCGKLPVSASTVPAWALRVTPSEGRWDTQFDEDDVAHVVPLHGLKHDLSMRCWCHPVADDGYAEPAISHNVAH